MKLANALLCLFLLGFAVTTASATAQAQSRAVQSIKKNDANGDGKISRSEWRKKKSIFKKIDTNKDGYLTIQELRVRFGESAIGETVTLLEGATTLEAVDKELLCAMGRGFGCDIGLAIQRGLFETGLRPRFPAGAQCRDIDEQFAISYTRKRNRENYHGGIDMPAPRGTPMIAAAAGTVIAKYRGEKTPRGIEIVLRHSPEDTGLPVWVYTRYTHFSKMPNLELGQRVRLGQELGPTGNSGINVRTGRQSNKRRPAIHFEVFFSTSDKFIPLRRKIIPVDGYWMDPNALFRKKPPFDSQLLKTLPEDEKNILISIMFEDGKTLPARTKLIWPYTCKHK